RVPDPADPVGFGRGEAHVGGELVREPADLTPAHRVGLTGERERAHARPADAASGEVAVDDGVDLVGTLRRLVDALRIAGDDPAAGVEQVEEACDLAFGQSGRSRGP